MNLTITIFFNFQILSFLLQARGKAVSKKVLKQFFCENNPQGFEISSMTVQGVQRQTRLSKMLMVYETNYLSAKHPNLNFVVVVIISFLFSMFLMRLQPLLRLVCTYKVCCSFFKGILMSLFIDHHSGKDVDIALFKKICTYFRILYLKGNVRVFFVFQDTWEFFCTGHPCVFVLFVNALFPKQEG
ncbi:Serine--tRNA ligase [Frankliniella fusca]|uniref:Serine--tRNA ligase n=1 Tax=Frankliniella fusca TaxID=407009 RepID=A0AAE1H607_9NEOP|nr:Serine--tRNA ligase [Frankliniella fusca]